MKTLSSLVITLAASISLFAQTSTPKLELPELHVIKTVTLSPSYSCRPADEFQRGYQSTAVFLSPYSKQRNSPDLLFNGACRSEDYFEAATAGDDMSLVADLGADVSFEDVSAIRAFNLERVHSASAYSRFSKVANVKQGHTYAVLLNGQDKRGLFIFTVVSYVPNVKVELRYAVKSYQIMPAGQIVSPGFEWEKKNGEAGSASISRN